MPKRVNLIGQSFGRLTVIQAAPSRRGSDGVSVTMWKCICSCGKEVEVRTKNLKNGGTTSCGCYRSEHVAKKNFKHGAALRENTSTEYEIWCGMIKRCEDPNCRSYKNYGGRGIVICDQWRHSFASFLEDMGERPSSDHSIERIDNNGNYEPSNCKWGTAFEQSNNRRYNIIGAYNGTTAPLKTLWRKFGQHLTYSGFCARVNRGWTLEEIFNTQKLQSRYDRFR